MASILVLYHSQEHGNTRILAEAVAEGVREAGAEVRLVNTNEQRLDIQDYRTVDAVAFGSPDYYSYIAGGMKVFLDDWFIAKQFDPTGLAGKPYGLFYTHGGGGGVVAVLEKMFERMGTQLGETIGCTGRAGEETLDACRQLGKDLAEAAPNA